MDVDRWRPCRAPSSAADAQQPTKYRPALPKKVHFCYADRRAHSLPEYLVRDRVAHISCRFFFYFPLPFRFCCCFRFVSFYHYSYSRLSCVLFSITSLCRIRTYLSLAPRSFLLFANLYSNNAHPRPIKSDRAGNGTCIGVRIASTALVS